MFATMARTKVITVHQHEHKSVAFIFNLRCLLRWLSIIGIPLPTNRFKSVYRFIILGFVLVIQISLNVHIFLNLENVVSSYTPNASSSTINWNYLIDAVNMGIHTIGTHSAILIITHPKTWKTLIDSLQQSICADIYHKCRTVARNTIIFTLISVT